jgi:hypothetical protein
MWWVSVAVENVAAFGSDASAAQYATIVAYEVQRITTRPSIWAIANRFAKI